MTTNDRYTYTSASGKNYYVTIGLEIHAELKTKTKMFSKSLNNPDETHPNINIDPVSMAHPGTLPVVNKKAVEHMIRIGLAVDGEIANFTEFDRKNYFYPDIPKAYQISQYKYPIVSGGRLAGVDITRIHLEEDTGTSRHEGDYSLIDFNRAGVPLMELVTEPVIFSPEKIGEFARELQLLLRTLGAGDANMEKGEMRVEVNISVSADPDTYGTKVEVKNINSFKAAEKAAQCEIKRMVDLIEDGKIDQIVQETRGWSEPKQNTFSQRSKEDAQDYRYFPDPDIPKLYLHEIFDLSAMKAGLPELPWEKRVRYAALGIKQDDIEMFVVDQLLADLFESVVEKLESQDLQKAANYINSDLVWLRDTQENFSYPDAQAFAQLMQMGIANEINSRGVKDILAVLTQDGGDPKQIAEQRGLLQQSDEGVLEKIARDVIDANESVAAEYKNGNENSIKFLMGQVMKESKGSANPQVAMKILEKLLNND